MRIALVTWSGLPELSLDDQLLARELYLRAHEVAATVWSDDAVRWDAFDAIVLRSTWDYHLRADEFRSWLATLRTAPVWNPVRVVERNLHKRYLLDLPNVVPTRWVQAGTQVEVSERSVVKPVVSATAYRTTIVTNTFTAEFEALLQPFVPEIVEKGEWSLIFFAGRFSHAVLKRARAGDFRVQNDFGGTVTPAMPSPQLLDDARRIVATIEEPWLYARVDGVERDGRLLLMELELTEPSLFLATAPEAAASMAVALESVACDSGIPALRHG